MMSMWGKQCSTLSFICICSFRLLPQTPLPVVFYRKSGQHWWTQDADHIVSAEDLVHSIEAPAVSSVGRREYYTFNVRHSAATPNKSQNDTLFIQRIPTLAVFFQLHPHPTHTQVRHQCAWQAEELPQLLLYHHQSPTQALVYTSSGPCWQERPLERLLCSVTATYTLL